MNDDAPHWAPSAARIAAAQITRFHAFAHDHGAPQGDYAALWQWSVDEPAAFWSAVFDFTGVIADRADGPVLRDGDRMPGATWFDGTRLNFAENLLRGSDQGPAIIATDERGRRREITWDRLRSEVARVAAGLRDAGVGIGDRVAGFLPNLPEAIVAMLATSSVGATWSSCSPDFGIRGVLDRFGQIAPKVLFTADGYFYGGKTLDSLERIRGILASLPSVQCVVVIANVAAAPDLGGLPSARHYSAFGRADAGLRVRAATFRPSALHPVLVGHDGRAEVHRARRGRHAAAAPERTPAARGRASWRPPVLLHDLRLDDVELARQRAGVAGNRRPLRRFALSSGRGRALAAGERGARRPSSAPARSTSLRWRKAATGRSRHVALPELRSILSTGSPLAHEQYDFVADAIGKDIQLASISGGTDIVSCFALGNPTLPVHRGELQCRGLGMRVEVYDDDGRPVVGTQGELVCTAPFPSMPVGFWNDPDGSRYRAAYFERFPHAWCHGDFAVLTARGGLVILGRSDAVLNPGGVRIGTAEIYRQVEKLEEVLESVAIGQDWDNDVRVVLFVRLRPGVALDDTLERRIREVIRTNTTPRHVPARILAVADIPRTISGKIVELAVREVVHGRPVKNTDALANPAALECFRDRAELRS